uniref:mitogen-activated protein kinase kinase kinase kinase 4-like n=1 Tax=Styela clava TaxID=7725 RepID=UPI00193958B8|nr:mitogen-activated protein kinase kinase kinase kinase 4-like [Styela clava]
MAESKRIREIDDADLDCEPSTSSSGEGQSTSQIALRAEEDRNLDFAHNVQSIVRQLEKRGTMVAPTLVFKQGDTIGTNISGSSGFKLQQSSNILGSTSPTYEQAARPTDAEEHGTAGETPFHFKDSICLDHNLYLLYNEKLAKYGEVYRGLQTHKGSRGFDPIAIKSIKLSDENRKEVEIIRKLRSHPNVITVLQSGTYFFGPKEHLFIAMEYFKSKTLTDFVKDDPKPKTDEVKHKQIEQFVEAVDHIHINEVLHRDLKPDNILVSDNGRILKIIDFGLGKQLRKGHFVTKMSTLRVGTDGWRAPEIYLSDLCSKQSDIFSSALVIHFISTDGSHPFGNDPDSWNLNIKRYQGCDLSKLEGDLEDLVGWMLRFRPQDRPNIEQIRKHKYFHGQLVCPHPKLSSVVRSAPEKEVVKVKEEFEERMKQMELKNEQEKRDAERMRREHEKEMKRVQEEKRKMKIEIEKLKTGKKDFAQPSNISATNQLAVSTSANKSISQKTAEVKCQGSVVRSAPEKEVVKVKEEFEERMKQMELKNEQEKRDAERMRREHEKEMKRVQEEKRKMKIEIEKLKTGKKDFAQSSNISATNQLAVSTSANKSISQKTAEVKCQGAESQSSSQTTSGLRIINQQPSGGKWSWYFLRESLPGYEVKGTLVITYSFPAGSLMGVSYEAQEFTEYLPWNDGRICLNLLHQAFDAGLIFKIQEVGDRRGKIVWNDEFPHKTNKTGGPENNGYPDPNHLMKLKEALRVKGFQV